METKEIFFKLIRKHQDAICDKLNSLDGKQQFIEETWDRPEGGGGWSRVLQNGAVFEKAGVNVSEVHGPIPEGLQGELGTEGDQFYATGISLVIHPTNPFVPTCHANFRYFELKDSQGELKRSWFGGGADLTPYYLFEEDAKHFHQQFKAACDKTDADFYPKFKQQCDRYFHNKHRDEARGIGGIFFDRLQPGNPISEKQLLKFMEDCLDAFLPAYADIVQRRTHTPYQDEHRNWQLIRRGRYVEFNLIHDRGTLFGLKSNGRIESIFMSLPPLVQWPYNHQVEEGTEEHQLIEVLKSPKDWLNT